jgi:tRNA(fMet)-specific endonuclease VapC
MYLLDTNIIIFSFRGNEKVNKKIEEIGFKNCFISEITIAELKFGAAKSIKSDYHNKIIEEFLKKVEIIPIIEVLDIFVTEKVRLEKEGNKLDNFDLLIGSTAIATELILVTNNTKHLQRMAIKRIEDWTI